MKQSNGYLPEPMATEESADIEICSGNIEISPEIITGTSNEEVPSPFNLAPLKTKGSVPLFKQLATYKSRLKFCILLQFTLCFIVLFKVSEDILDRFEIFILSIEELYIPKPHWFEYVYLSNIIFAFSALSCLNKNLSSLKSYAAGTVVLGIMPLLIAAVYYFKDILEYAELKEEANVVRWKNYPVALYFYGFILVAFQIHMFSLYFVAKLLKIWRSKMKKV